MPGCPDVETPRESACNRGLTSRQFTTGMIMLRIRHASKLLLWLTASLILVASASAQAPAVPRTTGFLLRTFKDESGSHKYTVFVPHGYTPTKKWPAILFLHGAG